MNRFEREYYEAESFWARGALSDPSNQRRVNEVAKLVPADVRTLIDVGCGNGAFGHQLMKQRPDIVITGVDRSKSALAHVEFEKLQASIDAIPVQDRSFDCATCLQVIEHLPVDVYTRAISELRRIARTYIIIGVPYDEDIEANSTTCPSCRTRFNVDLHLSRFDEERMRTLLPGFRLIRSIFPGSKQRLWKLDDILNKAAAARRPEPGFLSPICPLCGYSEGDKTAISLGESTSPIRAPPGRVRKLVRSAAQVVRKAWPKEVVRGYWVTSLYERQ